jgi:E3 SUMO-protein ligase PIAS1
MNIVLSPDNIRHMREDSSLRVLLYCAAKSDLSSGNGPTDVSFPSQLEVKVNGSEVRANFKGLKNKPGSTRPADITAFITKQPSYTNSILVTYALTQKVGEKPFPKDSQVRYMKHICQCEHGD